jgi:hypothetical protein
MGYAGSGEETTGRRYGWCAESGAECKGEGEGDCEYAEEEGEFGAGTWLEWCMDDGFRVYSIVFMGKGVLGTEKARVGIG